MTLRRELLITAAAATILSVPSAHAAPPKHRRVVLHSAAPAADAALLEEVKALRSEVETLKSRLDQQTADATATKQQVETAQAQVQAVQGQVAQTQTEVAALPTSVAKQVDTSIDKARHADHFYYKGVTITPGGFIELAGIYRQHFQGNDIATSFAAIPFPNNRPSHVEEFRFSAHQSRVSLLTEGVVNDRIKLAAYAELDFQGGAQTANSNESNSFNPRLRHLYATADWIVGDDAGLHLLAGQNWSLVTMNQNGITPRGELTPPQIDGQYVPGFAWTRQPQVRLAADFLDHSLWFAVSAENPATTFGGTVPANVVYNAPAGQGFDAANTLSLNHVPDVVAKVAYEAKPAGHAVHVEGFGLYRNYSAHLTSGQNISSDSFAAGGGITAQIVPNFLDVQLSAMTGRGIGRYGAAQLADVTFRPDGSIRPLYETIMLAGATVHATKLLDLYLFAGQERESRADFGSVGGVLYGYGNALANNTGCLVEGGTCAGNSRIIRQLTGGFWDKVYQGRFGRAQVGFQYSYTDRTLFSALGGDPQAKQNIGFVSLRYYPF